MSDRAGTGVRAILLALALAGCAGEPAGEPGGSPAPTAEPSAPTTQAPTTTPPTTEAPTTATSRPTRKRTRPADPRWVFYTDDRRRYASPWFAGRHRLMIPYGCTEAPYYDPDPSCPGGQGFHHGVDVAMPCGTPLRAGRAAEVLDNGTLGPAYGARPVLLRASGMDVVIGHTTRVFVTPGDRVARGERFALAGDSGAPDGCHLHFEVRPPDGGYLQAVDPARLLGLR